MSVALPLRWQLRLWAWQRGSARLLAGFVLVHLALLTYAVRGGLSAGEILGRTQGNVWWLLFYAGFVLACAVHVPIGLMRIAEEWLGLRARAAQGFALAFALLLLALGLRAAWAVFA